MIRFFLFIAYRAVQSILLVLSATFVIFLLVDASPQPPSIIAPQQQETQNDSLFGRYQDWLGEVLRDEFGTSFVSRRPVQELIEERSEATFELMSPALSLALLVGLPLGVLLGLVRHGFIDQLLRPLVVLPAALPVFWLGLMLVYHLSFKQDAFPVGGRCDLVLTGDACNADFDHLFLPVLSLSVPLIGAVALWFRRALIELDQLTVRNVFSTAFRFLMLTFAPLLAQLFSLVILVEMVFAWPGIGRLLAEAVIQRDTPVVVGVLVTATLWIIQTYLGFSLLYAIFSVLMNESPRAYLLTTQPHLQGVAEEQARERTSRPALSQIVANAFTTVSVIVLSGVVVTALAADVLTDKSPTQTDVASRFLEPGTDGHVLGTDSLGRDYFARVLVGGRNSLSIAARAALIASGIGVFVGLIGGLAFGVLNKPINFFINWGVLTVHTVVLLGLLMFFVLVEDADSQGELALVIGLVSWGNCVPVVRGWVREVRFGITEGKFRDDQNEFLTRTLSDLGRVAVFALVWNMAAALLLETSLSFLGMGVLPPDPSWGSLLADAPQAFRMGAHLLTPPGLILTVTVFALLMITERLRDTFDFLRPEAAEDTGFVPDAQVVEA